MTEQVRGRPARAGPAAIRPARAGLRRSIVAVFAICAAVSVGIAGCGFELRQPPRLAFTRIALGGFDSHSLLGKALRDELAKSVRVVPAPAQAEVVLTALADVDAKTVSAPTAVGQVRGFRYRMLLRFGLSRPNGEVLLAPTEIEQIRDLSYAESQALAKEQEEATLLRDMRADIVSQVMRVLAAPRLATIGG